MLLVKMAGTVKQLSDTLYKVTRRYQDCRSESRLQTLYKLIQLKCRNMKR